ncbi:TPPP family protein CG45057-like [Ctenocephalides felis]|uniref:TPPP family protein CG45057-like n=1 Tax=Ctenocephalides felis TaxID=7515 RepID=UPI000E6E51D5|nr:TPPP family protein CG45057-like [Ctenocephalides felis]
MSRLQHLFAAYSKFGDTRSNGETITLTQSDKWMKQAKVIGKEITTTDTGICLENSSYNRSKIKKKSRTLTFENYLKFIDDLALSKNVDSKEIKAKLKHSGMPGLAAGATVNKLTDPSTYTGTHAQRFDRSGKGKGKAGREDSTSNDGYVQGYKHKNTYDKTHNK